MTSALRTRTCPDCGSAQWAGFGPCTTCGAWSHFDREAGGLGEMGCFCDSDACAIARCDAYPGEQQQGEGR